MPAEEGDIIIFRLHGLAELIRLDRLPGQLLPSACQVFAALLKIDLELFGSGLCLGGLSPCFFFGALEVSYLSPRLLLISYSLSISCVPDSGSASFLIWKVCKKWINGSFTSMYPVWLKVL